MFVKKDIIWRTMYKTIIISISITSTFNHSTPIFNRRQATIILQNISQLKALFKDDWESIIGNADTFIYLGGNEQSTHKYVSELLGKETISTKSSSQSKGRNGSYSQSIQQSGRDLMTPDEVRLLDNKNAIVFIRGERPVIDEKYDLMKHPNIQFTEDGGAAPYVHSPHCLYDMRYLFSILEENE